MPADRVVPGHVRADALQVCIHCSLDFLGSVIIALMRFDCGDLLLQAMPDVKVPTTPSD